ncbi:iron complex transport system substrate-binding protein [Solibacillus kalamii]|uniref:Iron siderophore-binding protein n=1 Tax=Solibacillus kalamii TaxID=1748298 RepID=A0ABX3ZHG3_9BACL|nr:iron-siderophore ABC transporter substrate-binding protein [Solibacillus kalamii]MBM7663612.1 iron complex transport system substrate-binding protein [Solibacillus kalamii]OUZ39130.1 iron siderophore-binding protein [Solibacillus kalamii]
MKMSLSKILGILLLLTVCVLAACNDSGETQEASSAEPTEEKSTSYTVEHAMGSTNITSTPEKIVVLTNEGTEALLALGIKPVGAVSSWSGEPWYEHIAEQMDGVEVVGQETAIDLEAIAKLKPDLIIGNKIRQEADYENLSKIAPTVFAETLTGQWKDNFSLYAEAVNAVDKGEEVLANYDAKIQETKESLGDVTNQSVSVVRFLSGTSRIYYTDSFSGVILKELGFNRVGQQADLFTKDNQMAVEVGKELIPQMDGDLLFYFTYLPTGDDSASATEAEWTADPLWQNLNAVKNGKAISVNDAVWNTAGGILAARKMLEEIQELLAP